MDNLSARSFLEQPELWRAAQAAVAAQRRQDEELLAAEAEAFSGNRLHARILAQIPLGEERIVVVDLGGHETKADVEYAQWAKLENRRRRREVRGPLVAQGHGGMRLVCAQDHPEEDAEHRQRIGAALATQEDEADDAERFRLLAEALFAPRPLVPATLQEARQTAAQSRIDFINSVYDSWDVAVMTDAEWAAWQLALKDITGKTDTVGAYASNKEGKLVWNTQFRPKLSATGKVRDIPSFPRLRQGE